MKKSKKDWSGESKVCKEMEKNALVIRRIM